MTYRAVTNVAPEGSEVHGSAVAGYFGTIRQDALDPILRSYGLERETFDPDAWYDYQLALDISTAAVDGGGKDVEIALGKAVGSSLLEAFNFTSIAKFVEKDATEVTTAVLRSMPDEFGYFFEKRGEHHYHITINVPTTDYVIYGIWWEICRHLAGSQEEFLILPQPGFGEGSTPGSFEVKWGKDV